MKTCLSCANNFQSLDWLCPRCGESPSELDGKPLFAPGLAFENDNFPPDFFECLFKVEATNFWFRARNELIVWALSTYFPQARKFLEIGCGTGYVLSGISRRLPALELWGSEIYKSGLEQAAKRLPDANLIQMDARSIPFSNEFDVIGAFDVLEHIQEDEAVLQEIRKALKQPHGGVILTVPQHRFLWSATDEFACHHRRYERDELERKLQQAGFELVKVTSFVSMLLPLMMLARFSKRGASAEHNLESELRMPAPLNKVLELVLAAERQIIRAGASLPMGGSLLAVATLRQ